MSKKRKDRTAAERMRRYRARKKIAKLQAALNDEKLTNLPEIDIVTLSLEPQVKVAILKRKWELEEKAPVKQKKEERIIDIAPATLREKGKQLARVKTSRARKV